jgi:hypothetical protein
MGLRRVLFRAEVLFISVEVPGFFIWPGGCWARGQVSWSLTGHLGMCRLQNRSGWRPPSCREPVHCPLELVPLRVLFPRCGQRYVSLTCLVTWTSGSSPSLLPKSSCGAVWHTSAAHPIETARIGFTCIKPTRPSMPHRPLSLGALEGFSTSERLHFSSSPSGSLVISRSTPPPQCRRPKLSAEPGPEPPADRTGGSTAARSGVETR